MKHFVKLAKYADQWVALSKDEKRVVAADKDFGKALAKALKKGEKNPVVLKVPSCAGGFVL
jgi:hypothetical protein